MNRREFLITTAAAVLATALRGARSRKSRKSRPNVLLIVTDDQLLETMEYMPKTERLLSDAGTTFRRAYAADPMCGPARASILTGRHVHNHGIKDNDGAEPLMHRLGTDRDTVATRLARSGYRTALFGKYQNDYRKTYVPPGWDTWHAFLPPFNEGNDINLSVNGEKRVALIKPHCSRHLPFRRFLLS